MCTSLQPRDKKTVRVWETRLFPVGRPTLAGLTNPKQLDRDIVGPAPLQSRRHQRLARSRDSLTVDSLKYFRVRH